MAQSYIIPDGLGDDPAGWFHFRQNDGQLLDHQANTAGDVKYYCSQMPSEVYLQENGLISWAGLVVADSTDTLFRIDMQPMIGYDEERYPVSSTIVAEEDADLPANYYLPQCGGYGIEDVPAYDRITWPDIYSRIHQQIYTCNDGYKIYYIIEPGGDPSDIRIEFTGQDAMTVSTSKVEFYTSNMYLALEGAVAYEVDGSNNATLLTWVPTFSQNTDGTVSIGTDTYNSSNTLVVQLGKAASRSAVADPRNMEHSTYVAGTSQDHPTAVFTAENGDVYYAGYGRSATFPGFTGPNIGFKASNDGFILQFNSNIKALQMTFFGSSDNDEISCGEITSYGEVYIGGTTWGTDLYHLAGQSSTNHSTFNSSTGMIARFDNNLKIAYSKYFGGSLLTQITDLAVSGHDAIVVGHSSSDQNFPRQTVSGYYDQGSNTSMINDAFVAKITNTLSVSYCSWLGGANTEENPRIDVDNSGNSYITMFTNSSASHTGCSGNTSGHTLPLCSASGAYNQGVSTNGDHFLMMFNSGFSLQWSTYIGGTSIEDQYSLDIVCDKTTTGKFYLTGITSDATVFPTSSATAGYIWTPGTANNVVYLMRFNNKSYDWHTFLGCAAGNAFNPRLTYTDNEEVVIAYNTNCGGATACGSTTPSSGAVPLCDNFGTKYHDGTNASVGDAMLTAFRSNNELFWSTFLGEGNLNMPTGLTFESTENKLYIVGGTTGNIVFSNQFPTHQLGSNSYFQTSNLGGKSGFLSRFSVEYANSVEEISDNGLKLKAYPVPSTQLVTIESPIGDSKTYQLIDISGKIITKGIFDGFKDNVDLSDLPRGQYIIQVNSTTGSSSISVIRE
ncbi:MAG: T9SS type A sorting domain-containing protein [Flavobacteriales bacterium]|nr:T9SS type A sorting domain-containing protein [Flavobacteriales bacterium]